MFVINGSLVLIAETAHESTHGEAVEIQDAPLWRRNIAFHSKKWKSRWHTSLWSIRVIAYFTLIVYLYATRNLHMFFVLLWVTSLLLWVINFENVCYYSSQQNRNKISTKKETFTIFTVVCTDERLEFNIADDYYFLLKQVLFMYLHENDFQHYWISIFI